MESKQRSFFVTDLYCSDGGSEFLYLMHTQIDNQIDTQIATQIDPINIFLFLLEITFLS